MSRDVVQKSNAGRKPKLPKRAVADYSEEERSARLAYSEIPTIAQVKGDDGKTITTSAQAAVDWIRDNLGLAISEGTIRRDTELGLVSVNLVAGKRQYSPRSLYDYAVLNSKVDAPRQGVSA